MSRMHERFSQGEVAVGAIMLTPGREIVELLGYSGLDFVCLDMMVTPLDWPEAAATVAAAAQYDVTSWLRVPSYPWHGDAVDPGLAAQILRGLSIGAECVLASVNTADQVRGILHPLTNPHRRYYIARGGTDRSDQQKAIDMRERAQRVIPIVESQSALDHLDEILAVEGVVQIYLGMGDLTAALGHPRDQFHPDVVAAVRSIVIRAERRGVVVSANTPRFSSGERAASDAATAAVHLASLGVKAVMGPRPTAVVQEFYERFLASIRAS